MSISSGVQLVRSRRRTSRATVVVLVLTLVPTPGDGHQRGVSYSDVRLEAGRLRYDLTIANHDLEEFDLDRDGQISNEEVIAGVPTLRRRLEGGIVVEAGGQRCALRLEDFLLDPVGSVVFRLRGPCPEDEPLQVAFLLLALSGSAGYNLATIRYRGHVAEHVFSRHDTEITLRGGASGALGRFFLLGVEHIATGYDHVLFLLALLMVGGGIAALVGIVTAFTVAHSITLALATLGVVRLPEPLVESAIALSIAWVALENIVFDRRQGRWRITFAFGLVHGLGFAAILRAMDLPARDLTVSLLAFNLGVEAGQVAVVLVAYPIISAVQRLRQRRVVVGAVSGVVLAFSLYWFVERALL